MDVVIKRRKKKITVKLKRNYIIPGSSKVHLNSNSKFSNYNSGIGIGHCNITLVSNYGSANTNLLELA